MNTFIYSGWEYGAEADVALKSEEKGRAESGAASFKQDIIVYQMTESRYCSQSRAKGNDFWRNDELNQE